MLQVAGFAGDSAQIGQNLGRLEGDFAVVVGLARPVGSGAISSTGQAYVLDGVRRGPQVALRVGSNAGVGVVAPADRALRVVLEQIGHGVVVVTRVAWFRLGFPHRRPPGGLGSVTAACPWIRLKDDLAILGDAAVVLVRDVVGKLGGEPLIAGGGCAERVVACGRIVRERRRGRPGEEELMGGKAWSLVGLEHPVGIAIVGCDLEIRFHNAIDNGRDQRDGAMAIRRHSRVLSLR